MTLEHLTEHGPWLVYLLSVVALLGASALGRLIGARRFAAVDATHRHLVGSVDTALFTVLALMVGFTFAMALARFDARRDAVLQEANAIGTTVLRAELLPSPQDAAAGDLLRQYAATRLALAREADSLDRHPDVIAQSRRLQGALWGIAKATMASESGAESVSLFVQSLNPMIELQEARLTVERNQVPDAVVLLQYIIALVAMGYTGYTVGLSGVRTLVPNALVGILVATIIGLVVDIDFPGNGLVTVSQQPMLDLAASMGL